MTTTYESIEQMLQGAGIRYEYDEETRYLKTVWMREQTPVMILVILLEEGELVQLRAPALLTATDPEGKPLLFRAMLQMAYETRLVQFEYDPMDGEVCTCIDIALEDAALTSEQLLRCCALLLDVSFLARGRLKTILETGQNPALDEDGVDEEEARQRQSQLDAMVDIATRMRNSRPS